MIDFDSYGDNGNGLESQEDEYIEDDHLTEDELDMLIESMVRTYEHNKTVKVGLLMNCPYCDKLIKKKSYQHKFCNTTCKDSYWNTVDEDRRDRAKLFGR